MASVFFKVPGKPQGKARPRVVEGHAYTPQKTKDFEQAVAWAFKAAGGKLLDGYIEVTVTAFYAIPKDTSKKTRELMERGIILPMVKPDIDNVVKAALDALNGIAYKDDNQVVKETGAKFYGKEPCLYIEVKTYDEKSGSEN